MVASPGAPARRPAAVKWAIAASAASFVALAVVAGLLMAGGESAVDGGGGRTAPTFSLPDVNDPSQRVSLPEGEPTVLYFFASWCVPCRKELPVVEEVSQSRDDVAFVGVNHLDQIDDARAFMAKYGSTLRSGHDPGGDVLLDYRLRGLPATVFIDANGDIDSTLHGQLDRETLEARIDDLTAGSQQ